MSHIRHFTNQLSRRVQLGCPRLILQRNQSTKTKSGKLTSLDQYHTERQAEKERRTQAYQAAKDRKDRENNRRDRTKKNYLRNQFRSWFDEMASKQSFLDRQARRSGLDWNIRVAAMIERLPVVTPDRHDWEVQYMDLKAELGRYDGIAYPKQFGLEDPLDQKVLTNEELYDLLPKGFTPAPRETEDDKSGNIQTLNRKLKTRVYLSLRSNDLHHWTLPMVDLDTDQHETFLDGAKRATKTVAGDDLELRCLSNCPMGVLVREYESEQEREEHGGAFGEKIFFMRVQYEDGDVDAVGKESYLKDMVDDWGWLSREEMVEKASGGGDGNEDDLALFYKYML